MCPDLGCPEPSLLDNEFYGSEVIRDLDEFKLRSDLIIANRNSPDLESDLSKVFTRDIFAEN